MSGALNTEELRNPLHGEVVSGGPLEVSIGGSIVFDIVALCRTAPFFCQCAASFETY